MHPRLIAAALGAIAGVLGICIAFSLVWSLYDQDGYHYKIFAIVLACLFLGPTVYVTFRGSNSEYGLKDAFAIVTFGWVMAGIVGALPFYVCGVLPTFEDCLFESVSGFTTTGASVFADVENLPRSLLFWRSLTHWLGGMGIIVLSVAILPLLGIGGMAMFRAEVPSPVMEKLKPTVAETAKTLWKVYVILSLAEAILLFAAGMTPFDSICHTFGTMATGGFSTKNSSIGYYDNPTIYIIIIFFMLVAGANFTLHYQAWKLDLGAYWRSLEFRVYVLVFLLSSGFIAWNVYGQPFPSFSSALLESAFQASSIMTTTGFVTWNWELWPWSCQWLLLCLMFMGGCAGSTGGGMKCMRLVIVAKHAIRELKLLTHPRAVIALKLDGNSINEHIINSILAFISLFLAVWSVSVLLLVMMEIDVVTAIGAVSATLGNVGPGLNLVGAADNYGWLPLSAKWVLIFDMLAGRLELYTVIVLMVPHFWRK